MTDLSLSSLRDLLRERPQGLTFADLPETVLEDLALGWSGGRATAKVAAELAARIDGIPADGRDREIAGRALLTLLARRGAPIQTDWEADSVRLLGNPQADSGDPEAVQTYTRREAEYASLDDLPSEISLDEYTADLAGAFAAARENPDPPPPPDAVAANHRLALLHTGLPAGLRAWFHGRYGAERGDAVAWRFVLIGRAIAHHRMGMLETGVLRGLGDADPKIPERLVTALLAQDLGSLARSAILDPVL